MTISLGKFCPLEKLYRKSLRMEREEVGHFHCSERLEDLMGSEEVLMGF